MTLVTYLLCKHKKLKTLVASLAMLQIKEVSVITQVEIITKCKILNCITLTL